MNQSQDSQGSSYEKVSDVMETSSTVSETPELIIDTDDHTENEEVTNNKRSTFSMTEPALLEANVPFSTELMQDYLR